MHYYYCILILELCPSDCARGINLCDALLNVLVIVLVLWQYQNIFFCYQHFLFFSHITQHSIQNITKQNNRHILNISRSSQKGGREGRTIRTQKSLLYTITYIKEKTLPSISGRRPGPTDSRRCTFTWHYLQEATDPICFSTHVWIKTFEVTCYSCCIRFNIWTYFFFCFWVLVNRPVLYLLAMIHWNAPVVKLFWNENFIYGWAQNMVQPITANTGQLHTLYAIHLYFTQCLS